MRCGRMAWRPAFACGLLVPSGEEFGDEVAEFTVGLADEVDLGLGVERLGNVRGDLGEVGVGALAGAVRASRPRLGFGWGSRPRGWFCLLPTADQPGEFARFRVQPLPASSACNRSSQRVAWGGVKVCERVEEVAALQAAGLIWPATRSAGPG